MRKIEPKLKLACFSSRNFWCGCCVLRRFQELKGYSGLRLWMALFSGLTFLTINNILILSRIITVRNEKLTFNDGTNQVSGSCVFWLEPDEEGEFEKLVPVCTRRTLAASLLHHSTWYLTLPLPSIPIPQPTHRHIWINVQVSSTEFWRSKLGVAGLIFQFLDPKGL